MTLSYKKIRMFSILYAVIPIVIFYIGWLMPIPSVLFLILLALSVMFFILRSTNDKDTIVTVSPKCIIAVAVIALLWCFLAGHGSFIHQSSDNIIRNAIFRDMIRLPWPVIYNGDQLLSYYIAHWILPAAIGKGTIFLTGSVNTGFLVGRIILLLWSSIGIFLAFLLLSIVTANNGKARIILSSCIFIFFSGLDLVGSLIRLSPVNYHLEWWAYFAQFSSFTTCLFWVYNQFIVSLIITLCIIHEDNVRNFAFLGILAFPFGPFPFVGIVLICIIKGIVMTIKKIKNKKLHEALKEIFSPQNITMIVAVGIPYALYYMSNSIISNDVSDDGAHIQTGLRLYEAFSGIKPLTYTLIVLKDYFLFIFLEVGVYFIILFLYHRKNHSHNIVFILSSATLLFIPMFQVGMSRDFSMRVSIPALIYIAVEFIKMINKELPNKFKEMNHVVDKNRLIAAAIIIFVIGAFTPIIEFKREITETIHIGAEKETDDLYMYSLNDYDSKENFAAPNYKQSLFYKYLLKK